MSFDADLWPALHLPAKDRFGPSGKRAIMLALDETQLFRHGHCGAEHLMVGAWRAGGDPGRRLDQVVDVEKLIDDAMAASSHNVWPTPKELAAARAARAAPADKIEARVLAAGSPPFTPRARTNLTASVTIAERAGLHTVDAESILLAVLADRTSVVGAVLRNQAARTGVLDRWEKDKSEWGALLGLIRETGKG